MGVSSDQVQFLICPEVGEYGTPDAGGWLELPIVSESMAADVQTTLSNLLNADRQVLDSILAGMSAAGDISSELVICPAFELLLASAMSCDATVNAAGSTTDPKVNNTYKVDSKLVSFTIQKRFPDPVNAGKYLYQVVTGCVVNTFSMSVSPSDAITYNCGIIGKEFIEFTTDRTAAGYTLGTVSSGALGTVTVLRAPDAVNLEFIGDDFKTEAGSAADIISSRCFGAFEYNINNNYRGIQCIGTLGNKSVNLGRCEVSGSGTIHLMDNALLKTLLSQDNIGLMFRVQKVDNPLTTFDGMFSAFFPAIKISANAVVAGGTGTDVVNEMSFNALYDSTEASTLTIVEGKGVVGTT